MGIKMSVLILLLTLTVFLSFLSKLLINTDELVISTLTEQLTKNQIKEFVEFQQKWQWSSYILLPFVLLVKISLIAYIIDIGCYIFNKKIAFKTLFNIVVKAEFVFLIVIVFKTLWFVLFQTSYTLEDLQYFYPLSAINITGYNDLQPWFVYPLQVLNLFEIAYWFILAYLIGKELKISSEKGLGIIASSYGVGLLILVVAIMFFTLNAS